MFFALKKLKTLPPEKMAERCASLLFLYEKDIESGKTVNSPYIRQLLETAGKSLETVSQKEQISYFYLLLSLLPEKPGKADTRTLENLRYFLLSFAGKEPSEWDLSLPSPDRSPECERKLLPINVFLDDLRSPFNLGSVFRTAESFCYENIFLSPSVPDPSHKRALRSAMGTIESMKWSRMTVESLPEPVFALETGGTLIDDFRFPQSGTVILGSEESGISRQAYEAAKKSLGIVTIPLYGNKGSINAGVAFGILSYCWVRSIEREAPAQKR